MVPTLNVYTTLSGNDILVGVCRFSLRRGRVGTTFSYDPAYLGNPLAFPIDPLLPLDAAPMHTEGLPGALRDSSPDRWGRHLIARRAIGQAEAAGSPPRTLDEVDYLIGVDDPTRQGALRLRVPASDERLAKSSNVPPAVELKRLVHASNQISQGIEGKEQVKMLLDAGSGSLGGARPKASVTDEGKLLLAKFSHPGDEWDIMAWEKTALDLAEKAGIAVPARRLVRLGSSAALVLDRFDRASSMLDGPRIPYLSAMSLLGAQDGAQADYAEVAEALADWTCEPEAQLRELFRRVCLSVALHNTDDHLRNLGLIRTKKDWLLSPAFDINIDPVASRQRATAVYGETGEGEAEGLVELAAICGLLARDATHEVARILDATSQWASVAAKNGCKQAEISLMSGAMLQSEERLRAAFGL